MGFRCLIDMALSLWSLNCWLRLWLRTLLLYLLTSSNIFRVTDLWCGGNPLSTRGIPSQRPVFFMCARANRWANGNGADDLRHRGIKPSLSINQSKGSTKQLNITHWNNTDSYCGFCGNTYCQIWDQILDKWNNDIIIDLLCKVWSQCRNMIPIRPCSNKTRIFQFVLIFAMLWIALSQVVQHTVS